MITSATFGTGAAGKVTVQATGAILLSGADANSSPSGIFSESDVAGAGGNAGSVTVTAGSLQLLGGGQISSSSFGSGNGGNVIVQVSGRGFVHGNRPWQPSHRLSRRLQFGRRPVATPAASC